MAVPAYINLFSAQTLAGPFVAQDTPVNDTIVGNASSGGGKFVPITILGVNGYIGKWQCNFSGQVSTGQFNAIRGFIVDCTNCGDISIVNSTTGYTFTAAGGAVTFAPWIGLANDLSFYIIGVKGVSLNIYVLNFSVAPQQIGAPNPRELDIGAAGYVTAVNNDPNALTLGGANTYVSRLFLDPVYSLGDMQVNFRLIDNVGGTSWGPIFEKLFIFPAGVFTLPPFMIDLSYTTTGALQAQVTAAPLQASGSPLTKTNNFRLDYTIWVEV